jgi:hypothetical protein
MTAPLDLPDLQCTRHAGRPAAARCPQCRRFFCRECVAEHRGRLLCAECLDDATRSIAPSQPGWGQALGKGLALIFALTLVWMFWSWAGWQLARWQHATHEGALWQDRPTTDAP